MERGEKRGRPAGGGARRFAIALVFALALGVAIVFAWQRAYMPGNELLFNRLWGLAIAAPFAGAVVASLNRRRDPEVVGDKVLRHDVPARVEHWTHALGTVVLLVSGIAMGCLFIPDLLSKTATNAMMNVHFVGVLLFLFGTAYWLCNAVQQPRRLREHFPDRHVVEYTVRHYGLMLGIKRFTMPPEGKYLESERAAFIFAIVVTAGIFVTGVVKVVAHVLDIPEPVMDAMTLVHDVFALLMLLFLVAHVFFAVFAPGSFPLFVSMVTGYLELDHAKADHAGWMEELEQEGRGELAAASREALDRLAG